MITFSKFGKKGRLGNQLFHLAGMIGLAKKYNQELRMPLWSYRRHFKGADYIIPETIRSFRKVEEGPFHYVPDQFKVAATGNWDINAWLQSEKYWEHCKDAVKDALTWDDQFSRNVLLGIPIKISDNAIAISIRRGDYVGNPNYDLLPVSYYMQALMKEFPDFLDRQILIFSDDMPYCKIHFAGLPNVWFAESLSDIVQLFIMSQCSGFVIANSTFSWWGAYLAELRDPAVKIVRPKYLFDGPLLQSSDSRDHWPDRWIVYDHKESDGSPKKYDLTDVTFTIPVMFDHPDRRNNLNLNVCLLQRSFETVIIIGEGITNQFQYMEASCCYMHFDLDKFHRTRMLNEMAMASYTPIIANWDADVAVPEVQVMVAVEMLRRGILDGAYPYDGRFARVPRKEWFQKLEQSMDVGIYKDARFPGSYPSHHSVGGAVLWNKEKFFEGGGENEHFVSHAPEDSERWTRFPMLGYKVGRVNGQLFHMDHWVGPDSSSGHAHRAHNQRIHAHFKGIKGQEAMWSYVKSWPWYGKKKVEV